MIYMVESARLAFWRVVGPTDLKFTAMCSDACDVA
jgi:hypothetical protein